MRALDLELLALNVLGLGLISCIRYPIPRASGHAKGGAWYPRQRAT